MKGFRLLLAALVLHSACPNVHGQVNQVVSLIREIKARVEGDGRMAQKTYDKFACWCEKKLEEKAKAIDDAKKSIEELQALILKLSGDLGAHQAEIKQLQKDIAANIAAQAEASELREKESVAYEAEKSEAEQCLGALEAAIKVLSGAGAAKKGKFLETFQEAQLLGVVGGIRQVLRRAASLDIVSENDMEAVRRFVSNPQQFARPAVTALQVDGSRGLDDYAALQLENNPFGDYAPQSTKIQGILKGMYDAFAADLEKANGEEAEKQKSFEALMATKQQELETLKAALAKETGDEAEKTKLKADSKGELDATKEQLKADEEYFEQTKATCREKAAVWSEITRLRTEELQSINVAISILSSPEAQKTFAAASTTLLQLVTRHSHSSTDVFDSSDGEDAYKRLRSLASRFDNLGLAQIAVMLKTGGHFDKVIVMIDKMIGLLRQEEKDDIEHRDRCQAGMAKNSNDNEDLLHDIEKSEESLKIMRDKEENMNKDLEALESEIDATKKSMDDRLDLRNEERKQFEQALKDDADAVALLDKAITALTDFYKNNKMPLELLQRTREPEYTIDDDKAPEAPSLEGGYKSRHEEKHGIIAILSMLKEDFASEMKTGRAEDAEAQKKYEEDRKALQDVLDAQEQSKVELEKVLTDLQSKITELDKLLDMKGTEKGENEKMGKAIGNDCAWVETHFDSRREKRQKEIDGLMEAKNILAGAEA